MIEVEMNEDIRKYETKFLGPLTLRGTVGCACGFIALIINFNLISIFGITDIYVKIVICGIISLPIFACGFVKMYGLPFEIYLSRVIYRLICPRRRLYKSTTYRNELRRIRNEEERVKLSKMSSKERKKYTKNKGKVKYSKKKEYQIFR